MAINEAQLKLAEELPEDYRDNAVALVNTMGEEIEGIGDQPITWSPSYLNLLQATSDMDSQPEGAAPGMMTLDDQLFKKNLQVIPLRLWYQRIYWDPDHESNQVLCRSPDGNLGLINKLCRNCEFSSFHEEMGKSPCTLQISTLNIFPDLSTMFYTTFQKSNYREGAAWKKMMSKAAVPPWKRIYEFESKKHPKHSNVKMISVTPLNGDDKYVPKELYPFLQSLSDQFGKDRQAHIADFKNMVEERARTGDLPKLESLSDEADDVIEHQTDGSDSSSTKEEERYSL